MEMSSRATQGLPLRIQRRKGRSSRFAVKCDPIASVVRGEKQIGEKNRQDVACEIMRDSETRVRLLSGGRVGCLLNLIRQQAQVQQLCLCSSFQVQCSSKGSGGRLLPPNQIRARRLKTLFALAQHFDDMSNSSEMGSFHTCSPDSSSISEQDAFQLEAKLSHMSILAKV